MHKGTFGVRKFILIVSAGTVVSAQSLISEPSSETWKEIVFSQVPITSEIDGNGNFVAAVRLEALRRVMCSDSWWTLDDDTILQAARLLKTVNDEIRPIPPAFRGSESAFSLLESVSFSNHEPSFQLFLRQFSGQLFDFVRFSIKEQMNAEERRMEHLKIKILRMDAFSESQRSILMSNAEQVPKPLDWNNPEEIATNMVEAVLKLRMHPKSACISYNGHYLDQKAAAQNQVLASCAIATISNSELVCNGRRDVDSIFAIAELMFYEIQSTQKTDEFPDNYSSGLSLVGKIRELAIEMKSARDRPTRKRLSEISSCLLTALAPYFKSAVGMVPKEQSQDWMLQCSEKAKMTQIERMKFMIGRANEK